MAVQASYKPSAGLTLDFLGASDWSDAPGLSLAPNGCPFGGLTVRTKKQALLCPMGRYTLNLAVKKRLIGAARKLAMDPQKPGAHSIIRKRKCTSGSMLNLKAAFDWSHTPGMRLAPNGLPFGGFEKFRDSIENLKI
ncbi:hypothetical protein [Absidia glauca]|uniref:Uncharacterized protein n=1 Tax=Absidia glauca TaxID=4829 RepID=A0A163JZN0_ABSGL|nr:hypothetical protein [Absidia glauca]